MQLTKIVFFLVKNRRWIPLATPVGAGESLRDSNHKFCISFKALSWSGNRRSGSTTEPRAGQVCTCTAEHWGQWHHAEQADSPVVSTSSSEVHGSKSTSSMKVVSLPSFTAAAPSLCSVLTPCAFQSRLTQHCRGEEHLESSQTSWIVPYMQSHLFSVSFSVSCTAKPPLMPLLTQKLPEVIWNSLDL